MYRELMQRAQLLDFPIVSLLVFVFVFATLIGRLLVKRDYDEVSALPLAPDDEAPRD